MLVIFILNALNIYDFYSTIENESYHMHFIIFEDMSKLYSRQIDTAEDIFSSFNTFHDLITLLKMKRYIFSLNYHPLHEQFESLLHEN